MSIFRWGWDSPRLAPIVGAVGAALLLTACVGPPPEPTPETLRVVDVAGSPARTNLAVYYVGSGGGAAGYTYSDVWVGPIADWSGDSGNPSPRLLPPNSRNLCEAMFEWLAEDELHITYALADVHDVYVVDELAEINGVAVTYEEGQVGSCEM